MKIVTGKKFKFKEKPKKTKTNKASITISLSKVRKKNVYFAIFMPGGLKVASARHLKCK